MCGFAGFYRRTEGGPTGGEALDVAAVLGRMTAALTHRGPDGEGQWIDLEAGIALGHRRLSIVDLGVTGAQPMRSPGGRWVLSFNGEIYNFLELRDELEAGGARFRGRSDTEVMLAAFDAWGLDGALQRFAGMFAFALWDCTRRELHLVRDRLGEKPLYYGWMDDTLLFGSELKALRVHPRFRGDLARDALALYLKYGYLPAPHSIHAGVRKLLPGTLLTVDARRQRERCYWSAGEVVARGQADPLQGEPREIVDELERALRRTVRQEMIADVPLGAFLSGGIDSSTVVALMQAESTRPVRTFTIGFHEGTHDEASFARDVARHLGTAHEELIVTPAEALAVIPRLPVLYDEPFADSSQIPTLLVAELARRHVKVSVSGDGGDELFGGYARYVECERLWSRIRRVPAGQRAMLFERVLDHAPEKWPRLRRWAEVLGARSNRALYDTIQSTPGASGLVLGARHPAVAFGAPVDVEPTGEPLHDMMFIDLVTYLPDDILVKVDRATMGVGLESRAPFLDHRIAELAWRIPIEHKLRGGVGKRLVRELLHRFVPPRLVDRPKMGFAVPLTAWLRGPLRSWARELLDDKRVRRDGILDAARLARTIAQHESGVYDWTPLLWRVLMFQSWLGAQRGMVSA